MARHIHIVVDKISHISPTTVPTAVYHPSINKVLIMSDVDSIFSSHSPCSQPGEERQRAVMSVQKYDQYYGVWCSIREKKGLHPGECTLFTYQSSPRGLNRVVYLSVELGPIIQI
ncbi:hypothetical protein Tco_1031164 [Tanacetum coccineum]|uniref:Uncharacterized protein n=1 Tax=Tanacetum coccineum TaxID=301880 RepID=A0ABQ5G874_9ASTR